MSRTPLMDMNPDTMRCGAGTRSRFLAANLLNNLITPSAVCYAAPLLSPRWCPHWYFKGGRISKRVKARRPGVETRVPVSGRPLRVEELDGYPDPERWVLEKFVTHPIFTRTTRIAAPQDHVSSMPALRSPQAAVWGPHLFLRDGSAELPVRIRHSGHLETVNVRRQVDRLRTMLFAAL